MRAFLIVVLALAASLFAASPAHAADHPTRVSFGEWIDGSAWQTTFPWDVQVTVRDTVAGQTVAGNSTCTGAGTVHFSYTTSRGASGTMPDDCLDLHGRGVGVLPDAARFALLPGDVVTFSAWFEATEAADYASSTAATARITAVATETSIDLYEPRGSAPTATSIALTAGLQPYGFDGMPGEDAPPGTWTVWIRQADGTEDGRVTHANVAMLDVEFHDLLPATAYTVTARFALAASDLGRHTAPADAAFSFTTLAGPATAEAASSPDPVATGIDDRAAADAIDDASAVPTSSASPVLPVVAIALVLLLAAAVITLVILRSRRTIG
jgi:hypothetical protein